MAVTIDSIVPIETQYGLAEVIAFNGLSDQKEHIIFAFGDWKRQNPVNVRIHSECLTGDVFSSKRCDCGPQLQESLRKFAKDSGLVIYLRQEGRGIGLINKLRAYQLQDLGFNTYEANQKLGYEDDLRDFSVAGEMLKALGISSVNLMSNNPRKAAGLTKMGIQTQRVFTSTHLCKENQRYLEAKAQYGGHDGLKILKMKEAVCD